MISQSELELEFILAKKISREERIREKAIELELKFDAKHPNYDLIEDEIIEVEDKIAHLVDEARSLGVAYTFDSDPNELEELIEQAARKESRYIQSMWSDYMFSRGVF